jgi:glycosyltransferase involved in cell wall biosynthesis
VTSDLEQGHRAEAAGAGVELELGPPGTMPVGAASAVFCAGVCQHPGDSVERLELIVGESRHRPEAVGMARPDLGGPTRASGFWATVPIAAGDRAGALTLRATVRLAGGAESTLPLGQVDVVEPAPPPSYDRAPPGLIAICMATFDPDPALFRRQVESLRAQTDDRWMCVISDDRSDPERYAQLLAAVGDDPRFVVSRSERRLGFYRNFERALRLAPAEAELVSLCDQDDRWHPEKLSVLRGALGDAALAYCDQRLVAADGAVLRDTLWKGRRNNHTNLASQLVANTTAGAAMLFHRELLDVALPFPELPGVPFHDHWLGLVALATGEVAYVDRPLYDYVQHGGAVFGAVAGGQPGGRGRRLRTLPRRWRAAYFYGYVPREVQARTLMRRCSGRLTPSKRRALARFVAARRSPGAFGWLVARALRALVGRNETLASELDLARGIAWRWLAVRARGRGRPDASLPSVDSFEQRRLRRWRARL